MSATTERLAGSAFARPEVRALSAYDLDRFPCRFKLDQNEMPWELPPGWKREMARRLTAASWSVYPDFHADRLRAGLADFCGWTADGVLAGNGSNELLQATLLAIAGPGVELLGMAPGFGLYPRFALASGASYRPLGPRADLALPLAELEAEIARDPRRPVLVASPNNPTGEAIAPATVERWLERLEAPLLLDNAYGEFCRHDYRPLLSHHRNLVLFGTFSKAWSLAGLRVGYLLADPALVAEIVKMKLPYNLGRAAAIAGELALETGELVARRVRHVVARREQWRERLATKFAEVFASEANFLLVRDDAARTTTARRRLEAAGIRVRDVSGTAGLEGCLRCTVGTGAALRAVEVALPVRTVDGSTT